MATPTIRKPYDGKRHRYSISFLDENGEIQSSHTEQHHKHAVDINSVLKAYDKTGLLVHVNDAKARYGDYTQINEYQDNLNMVIQAQESFAEMPAEIRKKFDNDPGKFLEFVSNPANMAEMVTLGLATPPPPDDPAPTDTTLPVDPVNALNEPAPTSDEA